MSSMRVKVSIGDPWEFGEAVGWVKPVGSLEISSGASGRLQLDGELTYNGYTYKVFEVSTRHVGSALSSIPDDGVACSFISLGAGREFHFTGAVYQA